MNQLIGQKCNEAFAREFWLSGELVSNCCCIFLRFSNAKIIKILYNDESHSWDAKESDEEPNRNKPLGDPEFFYPHNPISAIDGAELIFNGYTIDPEGNWILNFSNGVTLQLIHEPIEEKTYYEVRI